MSSFKLVLLKPTYILTLLLVHFDGIHISNAFDPVYSPLHETTDTVTCSICDSLGLPLKLDERVNENLTCVEAEAFFSQPENRTLCSNFFKELSDQCCEWPKTAAVDAYECNQNIRDEILSQPRITVVPPYSTFNQRIKIEVTLIYQMVQDINVKKSTASIFVGILLKWHDPRLAWNISSSKCLSSLSDVRVSESIENTEIWIPNFNLLNRVHGTENFAPTRAHLYHDGTVLWMQQGTITAVCSFLGMWKIPFDTLGCQFWFSTPGQYFDFEFITRDAIIYGRFAQKYKDFELDRSMVRSKKNHPFHLHINSTLHLKLFQSYLVLFLYP